MIHPGDVIWCLLMGFGIEELIETTVLEMSLSDQETEKKIQ